MKNRFVKLAVASSAVLLPLAAFAVGTADADISTGVENATATFNVVRDAGLIITISMIGWAFLKRIKRA